jgi:sodium-dependent phosphate cotransporter
VDSKKEYPLSVILKIAALLALVYLFLLSITLLTDIFKAAGEDTATRIIKTTSNQIVGLAIGVLATSIVQSSSLTTSLVVGLVACNALTIPLAIPIIMGANIGTSVTNIMVTMGYISKASEFKKAFAAAIVHDFFNILSVIVIFPLQYFFNVLGYISKFAGRLFETVGGLKIINPLGAILKPISKMIIDIFAFAPWLNIVIALALLFFSLRFIIKVMKSLVLKKIELLFDQYIFKTTLRAIIIGMIFTALVQSSSITTSLAIPLAGAGVLSLKRIFPYALGANLGTTITAFLASLATANISAITIAFCHFFFNLLGIAIFLPLKNIPIKMAGTFAEISAKHRYIPLIYIFSVFFLIPIILITLLG